MASTYSTNLALELIGTGEQSGTWGNTTNTNLGTLLEQAISGYVTQAITDGADTTITIPNGTTGVARNMAIEMTGALTATRNLIVPANKKLYFIFNNTSGGFAVTVKVTGLTGVSVPNGKKVILVSNGTDIVEAVNQVVGNLAVGGTLGVTGTSTLTGNVAIGASTLSYSALNIGTSTLSGATDNYAIYLHPTYQSSVTGAALGLLIQASTQATAFTASKVSGIQISNVTKGAGSTITTQIGLEILDQTQGGTNYAIQTNAGLVSFGGIVTASAQPAFLATSPGELNITGNGTLATLAFTTEVFDQGNNFASSTFTAPVTGKYALFASVTVAALATNHTEQNFQIVTSNRTYRGEYFTYASSCPFTGFSYKIAVLADMDAGDTAVVKLVISNGSLVVDVEAGDYSRFSGFLQS